MKVYALAFAVSLFAGLSTGIGGILSVFLGTGKKFLPVSLGFSAGVMIYVSFVELFAESQGILIKLYGEQGVVLTALSFFIGIMATLIIDQTLSGDINPHYAIARSGSIRDERLRRTGLFTAIGIVVHNFPEGIATFASSLTDLSLGLSVALAVAIHNIPEGIAVAAPVYSATGSRTTALRYAFFSGLAEPAGALISMLFLYKFMNDTAFAIILAAVAGIMVFISVDELLPTAREYGDPHLCVFGFLVGMAIMAATLAIL